MEPTSSVPNEFDKDTPEDIENASNEGLNYGKFVHMIFKMFCVQIFAESVEWMAQKKGHCFILAFAPEAFSTFIKNGMPNADYFPFVIFGNA